MIFDKGKDTYLKSYTYTSHSLLGEASQVRALSEVVPDTRGPEVAHVHPQRVLAAQVPNLRERVQQGHQPEEPSLPAHW